MSFRTPQKNTFEIILKILGLKPRFPIPGNLDELKKYGPYVQIKLKWESLWKTIWRKVK